MLLKSGDILWDSNHKTEAWTKWLIFCRRHYSNNFCCISIQITLKFVPWGLIDNESTLVQVMATNHYTWSDVEQDPRRHITSLCYIAYWPLGDLIEISANFLQWVPLDLTNDKSTLVLVMAWCRQTTSHYLSQCWPRSVSPYGLTRPQWVKAYEIMTTTGPMIFVRDKLL